MRRRALILVVAVLALSLLVRADAANQKLTDLSEVSVPGLTDLLYTVQSSTSYKLTSARYVGSMLPSLAQGRCTLTSGTPITTADVTGATSVYFTPLNGSLGGGSLLSLFDGTRWKVYAFSEITLALGTLSSGKNYDVFIYDNSGTLTGELSAAWTNDTTRADALTTQNGILVKNGATTRRYVCTIRTTSTTTTADAAATRYVWNQYNRVRRSMANATETTNSWTYSTATFRQANANTANQLDYVVGSADVLVTAFVRAGAGNSTGNISVVAGIGIDSTSANSAQLYGQNVPTAGGLFPATGHYTGYPGLGRHIIVWLEYAVATGTTTWYGDNNNPTVLQSGITGEIEG